MSSATAATATANSLVVVQTASAYTSHTHAAEVERTSMCDEIPNSTDIAACATSPTSSGYRRRTATAPATTAAVVAATSRWPPASWLSQTSSSPAASRTAATTRSTR